MRVAALGRTHWLYDAIELVASRGHEVVLIGTAPSAPEYRRHPSDFLALANRLGCDSFVSTSLRDAAVSAQIAACGAEVAISVNWPTLIARETRSFFAHGVLNAHPGALPRYRGNACPNWAILRGESSVGLTVHQMVDELDAGPIYLQDIWPLMDTDYIADVYAQLDTRIPTLLANTVDALASGTATPRPQSTQPADALRCYPRRPEDGVIDWKLSARDLARLVRASAEPFAGATTAHGSTVMTVWRAREFRDAVPSAGVAGQVVAIDHASGAVHVLCGDGLLELQSVEVDGVRDCPARFIRSTRDRLEMPHVAESRQLAARIAHLESQLQGVLARSGSLR